MVSRLEDLCGIQMAIVLANKLEFKKEILNLADFDSLWNDGYQPRFGDMEKEVLDALKKLPFGLRKKIPRHVVTLCLFESIKWAKFCKKEFDLPFEYSYSFLRSSFFTSRGILVEEKAARDILKDTELSPSFKFCIACHYCWSDVIPALWEQLPEHKRPKVENKVFENGFCIGGRDERADIWSYFLLGGLQVLMERRDDSFSLHKFKKTFNNKSYRNCSDVAFKKCFEKLRESKKEEAVIFTRDKLKNLLSDMENFGKCVDGPHPDLYLPFKKYLKMALFFLHNMKEGQLLVFFQPVMLHYVLFHSFRWPYQHIFRDVVGHFCKMLLESGSCFLLHKAVDLIKKKSCKLRYYNNISRGFRIKSSSSEKVFFRLEGVYKKDMLIEFT
ncbi:UNVERIFIED_CONTAM: hypothetical protein RMT77_015052 [Armadillidium vulgare]